MQSYGLYAIMGWQASESELQSRGSKGMSVVLEESRADTRKMNADQMRAVLSSHSDFKNEKSSVERLLGEKKGHIVYMLPKF